MWHWIENGMGWWCQMPFVFWIPARACSSLGFIVLITTVIEWKWMTKVLWVILRKNEVWHVEIREWLLMSPELGCESRLVWLPVDAGRIFFSLRSCVSYLWNSFESAPKWFSGCNCCIMAKDSRVQTPTSMRSLHVNPALLDLWNFQSLKKKKHATSTLPVQVQDTFVKDIPDFISW